MTELFLIPESRTKIFFNYCCCILAIILAPVTHKMTSKIENAIKSYQNYIYQIHYKGNVRAEHSLNMNAVVPGLHRRKLR
jgi:hypothetical protein